jgi:hypothetical protein
MSKRRLGKDDLEETASYDELERTIFGDESKQKRNYSGNNSRPISRK